MWVAQISLSAAALKCGVRSLDRLGLPFYGDVYRAANQVELGLTQGYPTYSDAAKAQTRLYPPPLYRIVNFVDTGRTALLRIREKRQRGIGQWGRAPSKSLDMTADAFYRSFW